MATLQLNLPWPPSANRYWRFVGGSIPYVSPEAKKYIQQIKKLHLLNQFCFNGRLELNIQAFPPDKRKRDIDNILKVTCDSLERAGFFINDSQIDKITVERNELFKPGGKLMVEIIERAGG